MIIFFLKKLRKLFKSIGKLENKVIDKLILIEKKNNNKFENFFINSHNFLNLRSQFKQKNNYPKKLAIVVCFYFNPKKINILKKTLQEINSYNFKIDLSSGKVNFYKSHKPLLIRLNCQN